MYLVFNGALLLDRSNRIVNTQEGKSKALRQMRFSSIEDIEKSLVLTYIKEAVENQKADKEIKVIKNNNAIDIYPSYY